MADSPIEIVASLFFDSWLNHCPELRDAASADNRHLIYKGDGVILDLLMRQLPQDQSLRVSGQILHGPTKMQSFDDVSNLAVSMEQGESRFSIRTNQLGEFIFNSIPDGNWTLTIDFDKQRLVVRDLSARKPRLS